MAPQNTGVHTSIILQVLTRGQSVVNYSNAKFIVIMQIYASSQLKETCSRLALLLG